MEFEVMRSETILVVDDDEAALNFCCDLLSRDGYAVLRAQSGPEALEICDRESHRISLTLVDVVMPEMTGIDLIKRLEATDRSRKIALMSGYSPEEVDRLIGSEGSTYRIFWKPFDVRLFLQMIRNVLEAPQRERANVARY
jgi:two-component system cell cycle response regulator